MPKLSRHDFNLQQKKKLAKKIQPKNITNVKKMNHQHIQEAVNKSKQCKVMYKCCDVISFSVVRFLRTLLYGPDITVKSRLKTLCKWLYDIVEHNKLMYAQQQLGEFTGKSKMRWWFIYDLSYSVSTKIRRIDCCHDCFIRATGFSSATVRKYLTLIREGKLDLVTTERERLSGCHGKSMEWMLVHSWIEMFVEDCACKTPDEMKSELPTISSRHNMWTLFCMQWNEGVFKGSYSRQFTGRRKKMEVPKDVANPPVEQVAELVDVEEFDENGNKEPARKAKHESVLNFDPPSYGFFCRVWREEFANEYKIPRHHKRFAQCNWCSEIKGNLRYAKDEDKLYWRQALFEHYAWITRQREKYYKHRTKALQKGK